MTGIHRIAIEDLVVDERPKRTSPADAEVWSLNLDHIESDSGRILSKVMVLPKALGPSTYFFEAGTVLYSKLRPYLNKVVVADADGCATTELVPLKCDTGRVLPSYLAYFLRSPEFLNFANTTVAGAKMPRMVMGEFWQYQVPLPPLPEQRRIVSILDKADALRTKRREALAQLDCLAQSIFVEMFGDALRSAVRRPLGTLVEEFRYGTSNKSGEEGYPALRIPNVVGGALDLVELKTVSVDANEFSRLRLRDGDLLFVRTNGNQDNVGRSAVFSRNEVAASGFDVDSFIYASYLIRARLKPQSILPAVLQFFLSTEEGRRELRFYSKTSAGQFNINTEGLGALLIPDFSIGLQECFVERLKAIELQRSAQKSCSKEFDSLFASLQHHAFRGRL